ncbi:Nif11-like leader peptide family natural product precursor [Sporomusa malonica]|uniref:Nif11-like leader peptide domain-containing protein n=1 Tax=Sporomusa malonica TaxID=112901 RepID=A0A1W1YAP5_9FIRM|nr:Nif11-like leader peptide family natural product precursor [Sporomusa malonica]SMC33213.1 nif11-like leader peptide domain-containing protein [Sporomusa malonica]
MSIESARAFMERMKTDQDLATKIREFNNLEDVKEFIKKAGFDFTREELNEIRGELTEQELDNVAGGRYNNVCEEWYSGW